MGMVKKITHSSNVTIGPLTMLRYAFVLFAVLLLNSFTFAGHSAALTSGMSHGGMGEDHNSRNTATCITSCYAGIVQNENSVKENDEEDQDDGKPIAFFYTQNQPRQLDEKTIRQRLYAATEIEPPPKVSIHLLHGLIRV